jgi:hypothetical protein
MITRAERATIVELCRFSIEHRHALRAAFPHFFEEFHADNWEHLDRVIRKWEETDLDDLHPSLDPRRQ